MLISVISLFDGASSNSEGTSAVEVGSNQGRINFQTAKDTVCTQRDWRGIGEIVNGGGASLLLFR